MPTWLSPQALSSLAVAGALACVCLAVQRFFKPYLERDQYYYLKDISLIGAWALCGIWSDSPMLRATITAGVLCGLLGFCQKVQTRFDMRPGYWLIGLWLAVWGPRITFIGLPYGAFYYLSEVPSIIITALWVGLFPVLMQEIDRIPGLGGLMLTVGWLLMLAVTVVGSGEWNDAVHISIIGFIFIGVFWSRHVHYYRRLGEPLAAMWGSLLGGASILGVTKGLTFTTLLVLPLGLYALPLLELSVNLVSTAFTARRTGHLVVYRMFINHGATHPTAVRMLTACCAALGVLAAMTEVGPYPVITRAGLLGFVAVGGGILVAIIAFSAEKKDTHNPGLWGLNLDNVSLNFALGKVRSWVQQKRFAMIVTLDSLGSLQGRGNERYRQIVNEAALVLPDGKGLVWALGFLGMPVQERLPGVEFVEHLCRQAAADGWKVFFLGGQPGIAQAAAEKLVKKYPGLQIAGCHHGYFADREQEVMDEIKNSGTELLFVGFGVPKQEYWIYEHMDALSAVVCMGIGGSMDVISGKLRRAPQSWQRVGMEWLYRLIQEPYRWKRAMKLPVFVALILRTKILGDKQKH